MTDVGLRNLGENLAELESLQKIHLNFHRCELLSDIGLGNLGQMFQVLSSIKEIELIFME